jgi:hypothetical protein
MEGKQLELLFRQFLIGKGYPAESLFSELALRTSAKVVYRIDMVILDTTNKEYIALIEFKSRVNDQIQISALGQFYKYFGLLGTRSIPAYLVFPISEDDFQILYLTDDNTLSPLSKEDFPLYETLSVKRIADEKAKLREGQEKKINELDRKRRTAKLSSYLAILSVTIGIVAAILSIFLQQTGLGKKDVITVISCDSLQNKYMDVNRRLISLERRISDNERLDSNLRIDTVYISSPQMTALQKRLIAIEDGISSSPEKTLSVLELRHEIELLKKADEYSKELSQSKIDALKSEVDIQNAWMLGILIAIFGTILALVVPNLLPRKTQNNLS